MTAATNSAVESRCTLIAGKDAGQLNHLVALIKEEGVQIVSVNSGKETLEKLRDNPFAAVIITMELDDMTGLELIEEIKKAKA